MSARPLRRRDRAGGIAGVDSREELARDRVATLARGRVQIIGICVSPRAPCGTTRIASARGVQCGLHESEARGSPAPRREAV